MMSKIWSKISHMKVGHKINGLSGFLILTNIWVVDTILYQLNLIKHELHEVSEEHMPLTELITKLTVEQFEQAIQFERGLRYVEPIRVIGQ